MKRLVVFAACLVASSASAAKLKVAATVSDLASIARAVGGEDVEVSLLARPTQDPHYVDAKPSLVVTLARADLLVLIGLDLEVGWLPTLLTASRNGALQRGAPGYLDCSTLVALKEVPTQRVDRSMGDVHPGGNPHYTKDPESAVKLAQGIAARLGQLAPEKASAFAARAQSFREEVERRIPRWKERLASLSGTPVVTYHRSLIYFTDWAGLRSAGFIEPKPGVPPSTAHVTQLLGQMKAAKVPLMLQESWYSAATSELLARQSGARLVRLPGMAGEAQSYPDYFEEIVAAISPEGKR